MLTGLIVAFALAAPPAPVKVHVFTRQAEFVDEESKGRADTVTDLEKDLGKSKEVQIVAQTDGADISVEVTQRGYEREAEGDPNTKSKVRLGGFGAGRKQDRKPDLVIRTILRRGDYSTEILGVCENGCLRWRAAASDASDNIVKWIRSNRERLAK